MGELLLCNQPIAAMPYYIESISVNIYSLEELCYYIAQNTYLLDRDFMCEELCTWLEKELKLIQLSDSLRERMHDEKRLSEFVADILRESGYCTPAEIKSILRVIQELEEKSDFECSKIRADQLMAKEKYLGSIYEYKRLLESDEVHEADKVMVGNIWHNLGTAYGRLFLFEEAIRCYEKAYAFNQNEESLRELLMAYRCQQDEKMFIEQAREHHMDETGMQAIRNEFSLAAQDMQDFEQKMDEVEGFLAEGKRKQYHDALNQIIFSWKEDYRRISRV